MIFGITGDLSRRKLMPSLYNLVRDNFLDAQTKIVGVTRRAVSTEAFLAELEAEMRAAGAPFEKEVFERLRSTVSIKRMDLTKTENYRELLEYVRNLEERAGACLSRLFYLAVPPGVLMGIVERLGESDLNGSCVHGKLPRILFEKPFGHDLRSGEELIEKTAQYFTEEQLFRIDHYVAKETVQNILTFRFRNPIFRDLWDAQHIARVDIMAAEKLDIEGRAVFYEQTGALRDLIQGHLLQLLTSFAMEEPRAFTSAGIHEAKAALLRSVVPVRADKVDESALRGQYEGYGEEVNNPESRTETFAALRLFIKNARWGGVPFLIMTGKALAAKTTEITVYFRANESDSQYANILVFHIQPNEGIVIRLWVKRPGFEKKLEQASMTFSYRQSFDARLPGAYEQVLIDALRGDSTRFATGDEILSAWKIVEPVVQEWSRSRDGLHKYAKGSRGPALPGAWTRTEGPLF